MIEYLRIRPSGLVVGRFNSDKFQAAKKAKESTKDRERFCDEEIPTDSNILTLLRCVIDRIEPGVKLGDIFQMVKSYPLLEAFLAQYSWCWGIEDIHKEASRPPLKLYEPPADEEEDNPLVAISVEQYGTLDNDGWLEIGMDVSGRAEPTEKCKETKYGISMIPAYELADLPVELSDRLVINPRRAAPEIIDGRRAVTLLEFLDAIYWEISFYGGPEERDDLRDEMRQTVAEIKAGTANVRTADSFEEAIEKLDQDE